MSNPEQSDTIFLKPLGKVSDTTVFNFLEAELNKIFKIPVQIDSPIPVNPSAYNEKRDQYYSPIILKQLSKKERHEIILGVVEVDLYVEGLNFIFGQADIRNRKAIISLARLRQEYYGLKPNQNLFQKRTLTEAVHELGHVYGLSHCLNPQCVMFFSNSLRDTDVKGYEFRKTCQKKISIKDR
ncbi:MAG: archaemetzincin family Zn-dependent metalloprotease [bacterium]